MIFGHEIKVESFKNLAVNNKLGHAYLFYGDQGVGKFLFARHLAYFLESGEFEISDQVLLDAGIFAPNERKIISIEEARGIKKFLQETPFKSARRMAIIDRAETLTPEAQSSLLKIVEEPPSSALIIFIAHDPQVLFPPLLSRLNKIYFSRLSGEKLKNILIGKFNVSFKNAEVILEKSFGRLGRALQLIAAEFEQNTEEDFENSLKSYILALYQKDPIENSSKLAKLLQKEMEISRYNLNLRLQEKAVKYELGKSK